MPPNATHGPAAATPTTTTGPEPEPVFFLPNPFDIDGPLRPVAGPREVHGELASMVRDLIAGDLAAGQAACDWLAERLDDPLRQWQFGQLAGSLRKLVVAAIRRGLTGMVAVNHEFARRQFVANVVADWQNFRERVTELFAFELFSAEDALRFVAKVMMPGKLDGYAEG